MKIEGRTGTYLLGGALGAGGMASVHRATRLGERAPDGPSAVAVKRLHPHLLADAGVVTRFRNEGKIAIRLAHPNVVRVLEVVDGDAPALVMELCDGGSLLQLATATWNRGDAVPAPVASAIVVDLLSALTAAHEARDDDGAPDPIVHRDVSPHNVLVGRDGVARLGDFGIARIRDYTTSTGSGDLKGKIAYMAPELFGGKKASPASDLYATGVVLWELLASERLFEGEVAEVLGKMLAGSRDDLDLRKRGIASEVAAVVMRAIAPEPERRHESAAVMHDALCHAIPPASREEVAAWVEGAVLRLPGDEGVAPPSSATLVRRSAAPRRARRWGAWALAVALIAGASGGVYAISRVPAIAPATDAPRGDAPATALPSASAPVSPSDAPLEADPPKTAPSAIDDPPSPITSTTATSRTPPMASVSGENARAPSAATSGAPKAPGRSSPMEELNRERATGLAIIARNRAIAGCSIGSSLAAYVVTFFPGGEVVVDEAFPTAAGDRNHCIVDNMVRSLRNSFHYTGAKPLVVSVGVSGPRHDN